MEVAAPEFIYLYEANKVILVRAKNIERHPVKSGAYRI